MLVRKDNFFPNGVLQFNSTASFKSFWEKVQVDPYYANKVNKDFKTFKNQLDDFNVNQNVSSVTNSSTSNTTTVVDSAEFINDMKSYMLPEDNLASVINPNMQVIIADTLFQFTRMGLFKVRLANLSDYIAFYEANKNNIFFDSNYIKVPGETALTNGDFQVQTGIVRTDSVSNDLLNQRRPEYIDDGGGYGGGGGGNPGGGTGGGGTVPDYYTNSTVDGSFNKEVGIIFNDWTKRRLIFKTRKINWQFGGFGFHQIEIKAKIQKEKSFLWFTYWEKSYADEIITGFDNCTIETDFIFPYPNHYTAPVRPEFAGYANFALGDVILNTLNIKVNLTALGGSIPVLNNGQMSSWINKQFNTVIGNGYTNAYNLIEQQIINTIDPSFIPNHAAATKRIFEMNEAHRLKYVLGKAERPRGYDHKNDWIFDYNLAGSYTQNGGVGGYPIQYQYNYTIQKGSFYARARVGSVWHGIRIVAL